MQNSIKSAQHLTFESPEWKTWEANQSDPNPYATGGLGLNVDRESEMLSGGNPATLDLIRRVSQLEQELCLMKTELKSVSQQIWLTPVQR